MKRSKKSLVFIFASSVFILTSMVVQAQAATNKFVIAYTIKAPYVPAQGMAKLTEYSQACTNLASVVGVPASYILNCKGVHERLLPGAQAGVFPASLSSSGMLEKISFWYYTLIAVNPITVSNTITNYNSSSKFDYTAEPDFAYTMPSKNLQAISGGVVAGTCSGGPNDPLFCSQWALDNQGQSGGTVGADINLLGAPGGPGAWDKSRGEGIVVAILDTGVDYNHPDLAANIWANNDPVGDVPDSCDRVLSPTIALADDDCNGYIDDVHGWNFVSNNNDPMDTYGSGTHSAGIIAAVTGNGIGIAGIAPLAKIMPIKVATTNTTAPADSIVSQAVAYAILNGADVILMNFSIKDSNYYYCAQGQQCTTMELKYGYDNRVVLVAPVGTFPTNPTFPNLPMWPRFPAAFGSPYRPQDTLDVLGVGTTNRFDARGGNGNYSVTESSYGGYWAEIAASGTEVISTVPTSIDPTGYRTEISNPTGAAHVAGVAALMKGANREINHDQVKQILLSTKRTFLSPPALATHCPASPVPCNPAQPQYIGAGVIDATAAVDAVPSSNDAPVWRGVSVNGDDIEDTVGVNLDSNKTAQFKVLFDDADGDNLTITVQAGSAVADYTFDQTQKLFRWTVTAAEVGSPRVASTAQTLGTFGVRFIANDGHGGETMGPIFDIVVPWNCAPTFSSSMNPPTTLNWHVWDQLNYNMYGYDGCLVAPGAYQGISFHVTPAITYNGDNNPIGINQNPLPPGATYVDVPYSCYQQCTGRNCVTVCNFPSGRLSWKPLQIESRSMNFYISDRGAIVYNDSGILINDALLNSGAPNPLAQNPSARLTAGYTVTLNMVNEAPIFGPEFDATTRTMTVNATAGVPLNVDFTVTDAHNDARVVRDITPATFPSGATVSPYPAGGPDKFRFTWPSPQPPPNPRIVKLESQDYFDDGSGRHWGLVSSALPNPAQIIINFPITETVKPTVTIQRPVNYCNIEPPPVDFQAALSDNAGLQTYTLRLYRRAGDTLDLAYGSGTLLQTVTSPSLGGALSYTVTWPNSLRGIGYYRYDIEAVDTSTNSAQASKSFKVASTCIG